jgi:hypothetical protein
MLHRGKPDRKSEIRTSDFAPQQLFEFHKLAGIPMDKFKERVEVAKAKRVPKNGSLYL